MSAMIETSVFRLPGGMIDAAGERHRDGWLRPLTGRDEDWLCSLAPATRQAGLVSALLARCVARIGPYDLTTELSRELTVGDRDYLLVKLCEATLDSRLPRVLACPQPGCGAKLDLDLTVDDFPVIEKPVALRHRIRLEGDGAALDVEFHVPRGHDQELVAASPLTEPEALRDRLLESCVARVVVAEGGSELPFAALSPTARHALARAIEEAAPRVDLDLELVCPECSASFELAVDPAAILLDELAAGRSVLERELHLLAFHYHWSLDDLLQLTRPRRRRFLQLLSEELGARGGWS